MCTYVWLVNSICMHYGSSHVPFAFMNLLSRIDLTFLQALIWDSRTFPGYTNCKWELKKLIVLVYLIIKERERWNNIGETCMAIKLLAICHITPWDKVLFLSLMISINQWENFVWVYNNGSSLHDVFAIKRVHMNSCNAVNWLFTCVS